MSTRGIYGFYKNGVDKLTYSPYDSYLEGLGISIVDFIRETSIEDMNVIFDKIILVDGNVLATDDQIKECQKYYHNLNEKSGVVDQETERKRWNWLLFKARHNLSFYKEDLKYMIDSKEFIKDSLSCMWGYIINLDNNKLEVYRGIQNKPQDNRYYTESPLMQGYEENYYNCALVHEFDLEDIPDNWMEILKCYEECDEV